MRALLDTCVIVDVLQNRAPFAADGQAVFLAAANNRFVGCITAKSATDLYYLTHRHTHSDQASRAVLSKLFTLFEALDTAGSDCRHAIPSPTSDFEDAVMVETALRTEVDCIITRNCRDYAKSPLSVYTPAEFLQRLTELEEGE
jgi:predicted nucleic acid-binding protein